MSEGTRSLRCPVCEGELEGGFLSYGSGAVWHTEKPRGLGRLFWSAFAGGTQVFGSMLSSPVVSSVAASRCPKCGCVVIGVG